MAIAIVYMAKEFNWDHSIQGYVISSLYFGYFITIITGGMLADKFGGKRILSMAAAAWTLFTLLTPISARINVYCLILCRICLGMGEGPTYPSVHSLISKWFPPEERTRAITLAGVTNFIGMVITMPISNLLGSSQFGWESIFWVFAIVGSIWSAIWYFYGKSDPRDYPGISKEELNWILKSESTVYSEVNSRNYQLRSRQYITITDDDLSISESENDMLLPKNLVSTRPYYAHKIPWKLIFSRREVWAILLCQFFSSWSYFILLNWLPIFYYEYFHVDIHLIGFYTVGCICDYAIHQLKIRVITVRKSVNIIGSFGISIPLLLITYLAKTSFEGLLMITIGFALYSFQASSFVVSQLDIAPKYAGVMCALGIISGMVPAFFGVALTGWILEVTANNWSIIWRICSLLNIIGTAIYFAWAGGEVVVD
ncbi:1492_t:CDS:2 [Dentiscutata heterogama]|uniref:1492_t:CDS:1 n=1 Tax=Dentiscutata heterogama TaxID=1316150 RepID=A0ACA9KT36_9GLOM|nr:1492_t:CDS:2 [Dentiscutata heterogama]